MTSQPGSEVILKVGNGADPETFAAVGGLLLTSFSHHNRAVDVTTKDSGGWQTLLAYRTKSAVSISGSGRFEDSATEELVRTNAMASLINNYQIVFGNGDMLSGAFQITAYQRGGNNSSIEVYSISMSSSGPVVFTKA